MKYSESTKGFYDPTVHKNIPADAVDIADAVYKTALVTPVPVTKTKHEQDEYDSIIIYGNIKSIMTPDVMGDLIIFIASLNGAPQSIKTAANLVSIEKAKKPK